MKKRALGLLCALGIMISIIMPVSAATTFSDVPTGHWAYDDITAAAQLGMVNGYPNGTFQPGGTITSAEVASVVYKGFYDSTPVAPEYQSYYADVPSSHWAYVAITNAGWDLMDYYYDDPTTSYLRPDEPTNRLDVAYTVGRLAYWWSQPDATEPPAITPTSFKDAAMIDAACEPYFSYAVSIGLINGYPDGTFAPEATITRAEFATLIIRVIDFIAAS